MTSQDVKQDIKYTQLTEESEESNELPECPEMFKNIVQQNMSSSTFYVTVKREYRQLIPKSNRTILFSYRVERGFFYGLNESAQLIMRIAKVDYPNIRFSDGFCDGTDVILIVDQHSMKEYNGLK